jgi:hypothetical protein
LVVSPPPWPSSLHARDDEPGSDDDNYTSSSLDSSADGSDEHELKSNTKLESTSLGAARISGSSPGGCSERTNEPGVVNDDQSRSSSVDDDLDGNADTLDSKREYEFGSSIRPEVAIYDGTSPSERVDRDDELSSEHDDGGISSSGSISSLEAAGTLDISSTSERGKHANDPSVDSVGRSSREGGSGSLSREEELQETACATFLLSAVCHFF